MFIRIQPKGVIETTNSNVVNADVRCFVAELANTADHRQIDAKDDARDGNRNEWGVVEHR